MNSDVELKLRGCHKENSAAVSKIVNYESTSSTTEEPIKSIHFTRPGRYFSGIKPESRVLNPVQKQKQIRIRSLFHGKLPHGTDKTNETSQINLKPFTPYISPLSNLVNCSDSWSREKINNSENGKDQLESQVSQSSSKTVEELNQGNESELTENENTKKKSKFEPKSNLIDNVKKSMNDSIKDIQQTNLMKRNKNQRLANILNREFINPLKASKRLKKNNEVQANCKDSIVISSDEDDVILIPTPLSFPISLDSSSDESENTEIHSNKFIERCPSKTLNTRNSNNSSRCTSPSSVLSDDFIQQNDRSRLLKHTEMADDEDLILIQETVDRDQQNCMNEIIPEQNFVKPNKVHQKRKTDFVVTQSNFKGIDVYESESDMIESSVYSKGSKKTVQANTRPLINNKQSTLNDISLDLLGQSSDSENEFSCIVPGEAVEKLKDCVKNPFSQANSTITKKKNLTDNDFITLISTITEDKTEEGNDSDATVNDITAREIAEHVLSKCNKKSVNEPIEKQNNDKTTSNKNELLSNDLLAELSDIFKKIDDMEFESETEPSRSVTTEEIQPKSNEEFEITNDGTLYHVADYRTNNMKLTSELGWNEEMYKFYNQSWKGEKFDMYDLKSKMDPKANWKICTADRITKRRKNLNMKCVNCYEYGHTKARCTQPKKPPACYMCGNKGHLGSKCPNTLCLRCGEKTNSFQRSCESCRHFNTRLCFICNIRGHTMEWCPDRFRRYHSTTDPYTSKLTSNLEWNPRKYCCICAQKGHISDNCRNASRFLDYPPVSSNIQSYEHLYESYDVPPGHRIGYYHLHCNPQNKFEFKNSKNTIQQSCYSRFLKAVGLDENKESNQICLRTQRNLNESNKKRKTQRVTQFLKSRSEVMERNQERIRECNVSTTDDPNEIIIIDDENIFDESTANQEDFKIPENVFSENSSTLENIGEPLTVDSDSNYSFSEHFGSPEAQLKSMTPKLGPLSDFLPLQNNISENIDDRSKNELNTFFLEDDSENEANSNKKMPNNNEPSEAKIYLTNMHIKFLVSSDGNKYLVENSAKYNLTTNIEITPHGHILIIYGLPSNQDKFHLDLVTKFKSLNAQIRRDNFEKYQHIPKKTDALIRFLRDHLAQLETNLGNPNQLLLRLKFFENLSTKPAFKSSEKIRRLLNMILFGQAGLGNGKIHLQQYQEELRRLLNSNEDFVSNELRDEIKNHWEYIFSCYRHENYSDLVEIYNQLKTKNEITKVIIDPLLLKNNRQKVLLDSDKQPAAAIANMKNVQLTQSSFELNNSKNPMENTDLITLPDFREFINVPWDTSKPSGSVFLQKPNATEVSMDTQDFVEPIKEKILPKQTNQSVIKNENLQLEHSPKSSNILPKKRAKNIKENNLFWSKESIKFLDEFWNTHSNPRLLDRFKRVREKALRGLLSFNDYRAIIKIYNSIKNLKKKKTV